jgi:hypothetical protein
MTDQTERNYGRAFLVTAAAWAANPARRDGELAAPAGRLIYIGVCGSTTTRRHGVIVFCMLLISALSRGGRFTAL